MEQRTIDSFIWAAIGVVGVYCGNESFKDIYTPLWMDISITAAGAALVLNSARCLLFPEQRTVRDYFTDLYQKLR